MYRNRVRSKLRGHSAPQSRSRSIRKHEQLAFLRVVSDIEEYRYDTSAPPFLLSNLVKQYESALKELMPHELWTPSITEIPDLQYFKRGKQGYLVFNHKITQLLHDNLGNNDDEIETKVLQDAVRILRKVMFAHNNLFSGSLCHPVAQSSSIPSLLLSFVKRLLGGGTNVDTVDQSIMSISQLILYNSVKNRRGIEHTGIPRHHRSRETPIPVYTGLMIHNMTGQANLVNE